MNSVVIFVVPAGNARPDFENALNRQLDFLAAADSARLRERAAHTLNRGEDLPMWTWFLPNPRRDSS